MTPPAIREAPPPPATPRDAAAWARWGSPATSDALRRLGYCFQALDGGIRPIAPTMAAAGPAFTVRCYPGATWALEQALELAQPGDVLVVDGGGRHDVILMGGLMSTRLRARGIAGVVMDGAIRDVEEIIRLGLPVFTRHVCARAGTHDQIGDWQQVICCGRVPVSPGDWIVADASGVVAVPAGQVEAVAGIAAAIHDKEQAIARYLAEGCNFERAIRRYERETGAAGSTKPDAKA